MHKLLQRLFIESYVIVFHDSYIIPTLKVSSSPVFSLEHWLDRISLSGCISALVCATMVVQLARQGILFNIHAGTV